MAPKSIIGPLPCSFAAKLCYAVHSSCKVTLIGFQISSNIIEDMKALLSFAILITIFSEPFFTDGSPQFEKLDDILKKLPGSLIDLAKKQLEETDSKP